MRTLTAVLTHLDAERVDETLELLRRCVCGSELVVCHAGAREDFDRLAFDNKLYIDDPTLRGPARHLQSWNQIFHAVWWTHFARDETLDALYLIEYDHVILDPSFDRRLADLATDTGADFLAKNCVDRTGTNWEHYVRFRRDERLLHHLCSVSVREDPRRLFGCLGDGMWISRRALQAYVQIPEHPPCYCETYVPTLLHHLGFKVVNIDEYSDLYRHVRWATPFSVDEAVAELRQGAVFLHPVKDRDVVRALVAELEVADTVDSGQRRARTDFV
jgi:hypothetical protein